MEGRQGLMATRRAACVGVLDSIPPEMCVSCKAARALCGIDPCPLLQQVRSHLPRSAPVGRDLQGSSPPTLFVGRHGYPKVSVGPMLPAGHLDDDAARRLDSPATWLDGMSIPDVVGLRSSLVRTKHMLRVDAPATGGDRILDLSQELAIAARPVDAEVRLDRTPSFATDHVGSFTAPHGPSAGIEAARLTENVRVERPVERLTSDTDARSADALWEMYRAGVDPYQMERIMSAGMVGIGKQRRLVPTRWAITATDDTLGKALIDGLPLLPSIDKPTIHFAEHFGNRFHILLLPGPWGFELVESWQKGSFWASGRTEAAGNPVAEGDRTKGSLWAQGRSQPAEAPPTHTAPAVDWEDHRGRTRYASNTTGGYYAARMPILEWMHAARRRATAIVVREITDAYTTPLGVWVVRETTRRAMAAKGLVFEDTSSALRHLDRHVRLPDWQHHTQLLPRLRTQRRLESFEP